MLNKALARCKNRNQWQYAMASASVSQLTTDSLIYQAAFATEPSLVTRFATLPAEIVTFEGPQIIATNTNLGSTTPDTTTLVCRFNGDLTVDTGATLTAAVRKKGMILVVNGNLTVNGTISMAARGAVAAGQRLLLIEGFEIPAVGGAGGTGVSGTNTGKAGTTSSTGGGGSGSSYRGSGGAGGAGTSFSGGSGGGSGDGASGTAAAVNCGKGGNGAAGGGNYGGCGGVGNPGGTGAGSRNAGRVAPSGTGGLLVIYCTGNVLMTGILTANGVSQPTALTYPGGSSGGGAIRLFANSYTQSGQLTVKGGNPGPGAWCTNPGGDGSALTVQLTA